MLVPVIIKSFFIITSFKLILDKLNKLLHIPLFSIVLLDTYKLEFTVINLLDILSLVIINEFILVGPFITLLLLTNK